MKLKLLLTFSLIIIFNARASLDDYLSMDKLANMIALASDCVSDAQSISEIISNARNLISSSYKLNPALSNKAARLTLKINKNIKDLTTLIRQAQNSKANKKHLTIAIIKSIEQIGLYNKEIYRLYHPN